MSNGGQQRLALLLEDYAKKRPDVKPVLEALSPPERADVDELEKTLVSKGISRRQIISILKELAERGAGEFIVGRRDHPTRLEWQIEEFGSGASEQLAHAQVLKHRFRLRPDYEVELVLPSDLSGSEAGRLGDFIKTLPFE